MRRTLWLDGQRSLICTSLHLLSDGLCTPSNGLSCTPASSCVTDILLLLHLSSKLMSSADPYIFDSVSRCTLNQHALGGPLNQCYLFKDRQSGEIGAQAQFGGSKEKRMKRNGLEEASSFSDHTNLSCSRQRVSTCPFV